VVGEYFVIGLRVFSVEDSTNMRIVMMMTEMMKQCCNTEGRPDVEKMKQFMERCGKQGFSEEDKSMMEQFCSQEGMTDAEEMQKLMEKCGCHVT
jgi:hypothetical protein